MTTGRTIIGELRDDERGMSIAAVMFLGLAVVMLTSVVAVRAFRQGGSVDGDARWEQALHVAESGLDDGLVRMFQNEDYTTGEVMPDGLIPLKTPGRGSWPRPMPGPPTR